jgi:hypothetical protein
MVVALTAVGMCQAAATQAQNPLGAPARGNLPPEPAPISLTEPALPGPACPQNAASCVPDSLSLPASVPGAFTDRVEAKECAFYFHVGTQALERQHLGHLPLAVLDPSESGLNTGAVPLPINLTVIHDANSIVPNMAWGPRGTLGVLCDNHAFEVTGYYIPRTTSSTTTSQPGRIDGFFFNPPVGFEGDNGLWLQSDQMRTELSTTIYNVELNCRHWNRAVTEAELIIGIRYFDLQERLANTTGDDSLTVLDIFGHPDPTRIATYTVQTHNRLLAPQLGVEWNPDIFCWLSGAFIAKGAWGVNFSDVHTSLERADGLVGFTGSRSKEIFSHMYELSAALDVHFLERMRLRAGYTAMWLLNAPMPTEQVDFNLANPLGRRDDHGSVFFHGPMIEFLFLF